MRAGFSDLTKSGCLGARLFVCLLLQLCVCLRLCDCCACFMLVFMFNFSESNQIEIKITLLYLCMPELWCVCVFYKFLYFFIDALSVRFISGFRFVRPQMFKCAYLSVCVCVSLFYLLLIYRKFIECKTVKSDRLFPSIFFFCYFYLNKFVVLFLLLLRLLLSFLSLPLLLGFVTLLFQMFTFCNLNFITWTHLMIYCCSFASLEDDMPLVCVR